MTKSPRDFCAYRHFSPVKALFPGCPSARGLDYPRTASRGSGQDAPTKQEREPYGHLAEILRSPLPAQKKEALCASCSFLVRARGLEYPRIASRCSGQDAPTKRKLEFHGHLAEILRYPLPAPREYLRTPLGQANGSFFLFAQAREARPPVWDGQPLSPTSSVISPVKAST